jgi:hypothetical protein
MGCAAFKDAGVRATMVVKGGPGAVATPGPLSPVWAVPGAGPRLSQMHSARLSTNVRVTAMQAPLNRPVAAASCLPSGAGPPGVSAGLRPPTIQLQAQLVIGSQVPARRRGDAARVVLFLFGGARSHKGVVANMMTGEYGFELVQLEDFLLGWERTNGNAASTYRSLEADMAAHPELTWVSEWPPPRV